MFYGGSRLRRGRQDTVNNQTEKSDYGMLTELLIKKCTLVSFCRCAYFSSGTHAKGVTLKTPKNMVWINALSTSTMSILTNR